MSSQQIVESLMIPDEENTEDLEVKNDDVEGTNDSASSAKIKRIRAADAGLSNFCHHSLVYTLGTFMSLFLSGPYIVGYPRG
jgi:hypothetical protein